LDQPKRIKLLYIAGETRSGTTLLDRILGQTPGLFSTGELAWLWNEALGPARPEGASGEVNGRAISNYGNCGCASPIRECVVWRDIFKAAFGGLDQIDPAEMFQQQLAHRPRRSLWRRLTTGKAKNAQGPNAYLERMERLYRAIQAVTGCEVIIESSKDPAHLMVLAQLPVLDLRVLHLMRDPRAVAYSFVRRPLGKSYGALGNAGRWNKHNLAIEVLGRWHRLSRLPVHYEELVEAPRATAQRILEFVESVAPLPQFRSEREVELSANHTVYGNPNRFTIGPVPVRLDDEWRGKLRLRDQAAITVLTLPLLAYYGYPIRSRRPRGQPQSAGGRAEGTSRVKTSADAGYNQAEQADGHQGPSGEGQG
jgi:hypothetical protein